MKIQDVRFETFYKIPSRNGVYKPEKFHGSGWRIVNMGELFKYNFISDQEMNRVQLTHSEMRSNNLEDGDLLFGRRSLVEEGAGKCSIVINPIEPLTFESSIIRVRVDKKRVNPLFLFYNFKTNQGRGRIKAIVSGVNVKGIRGSDLKNIKLSLPYNNLDIQNKLVSIISSYDDLINTNHRRIQLLEEAARLLFREWFVYFRFPGHEKVKIVDRDGRKMPSDWDYLPFTKMKIFKKAPLGVPVFTDIRQYYQTSEIDGTTITGDGKEVDYENRPSRADIVPRINTVYFAKMKETDKVLYFNKGNSFLLEKILLSTGMVGFTTDKKYLGFLFGLLKSYEFVQYKNNFATGATQVSLNNASLKKIKVLFPALNLVELYSEIVNPLLEECSLLRSQNQKLTQARDLLLPRLMSGEIEV
jgi:type I restriction enzyme S subunit